MPEFFQNQDARRIWEQLKRIADLLELLILPQTEPDEAQPTGCQHPEDQRVSFGLTPDGQEEWECRQCRTRFP